MKDRIKES